MEDAFAYFGISRRPLIDEPALKETYLRLAADRHPDASGGDDEEFHLVQEAYKTLRDPATRLRHLLELVFPTFKRDGGHVPHADLFLQAGNAVQAARTVWQRFENTSSALARALLSPEIAEALRQIRTPTMGWRDNSKTWTSDGRMFPQMSSPLWRLHSGMFPGGKRSCQNGNFSSRAVRISRR